MKSKAIHQAWVAYMQQLAICGKSEPEPVANSAPMAIVFGTDEVKVNVAKRTIKIPGMGVIPFDGDVSHIAFDWVAIHQQQGEWSVTFGSGSPFGIEAAQILPSKNGVVYAVPGSLA